MDHSTVRSALALAVRADLPVLLWGPPGTGKSATVRALGRQLGLPVEVVVGSVREPADFSGLPIVHGGGTRFAPPRWAERLAEAGSGLLFLDELTTAPPAVQAAMLRVVLERTVGDLVLPEGVRIVAAANPPGLAADGWELSAPLANRLVHLDWQVTAEEISQGFVHGFDTEVGGESDARAVALAAAESGPRSETNPTTAHAAGIGEAPPAPPVPPSPIRVAEARAAVGSFLRVRPELVLDVPDSPERAGRAWPSPRTWEMAATALASGNSDRPQARPRNGNGISDEYGAHTGDRNANVPLNGNGTASGTGPRSGNRNDSGMGPQVRADTSTGNGNGSRGRNGTYPHAGNRNGNGSQGWESLNAENEAPASANPSDAAVAALVVGAVGEAAGFELLSWLRTLDLPSPEQLLADPHQPLPDRVDRLHALLGALSAHVTADGSPAAWERSWEVVARVARTAPDVAADTARTLAARRPDGATPPAALLELVPVLRSAGLMS